MDPDPDDDLIYPDDPLYELIPDMSTGWVGEWWRPAPG